MFNAAIVGAGYVGTLHTKILMQEFGNVRISAVVDNAKKKGEKLAREAGAPYFHDYDEMLDRGDADIVAVKKNKVRAITAHVLRFWPVYVRGKQIIETKGLGRLINGYCERLLTFPSNTEKAWNRREGMSGDVALDVRIRDPDYLIWLFGPPLQVASTAVRNSSFGGCRHIVSNVTFKNGAKGSVQAGWGFPVDFPFTMGFRILCEKGAVEWSFRAGRLLEERARQTSLRVYNADGSVEDDQTDPKDPFAIQWRYFLDCVEKGNKISNVRLEDGRNALALAKATVDSVKMNRPIAFKYD